MRDDAQRAFKNYVKTLPPDQVLLETAENINEFFFNNIKDNLHLSICMSPIGAAFRNYCRMYPALINNTTINWFMKWPEDALTEVAKKFVGGMSVPEEKKENIARLCGF